MGLLAPVGPGWLAPLSVGVVGLGGWLGFRLRDPSPNHPLALASRHYGYLDRLYTYLVVGPCLRLAKFTSQTDRWVLDGLVNGVGVGTVLLAHTARFLDRLGVDGLVNGAGSAAMRLGQLARGVQGGRVQTYIATAIGVVLMMLWLLR